MADETPVLALPFPEGDDAPNGPAAIQALAEAVEGAIIPPGLAAGQAALWNGSEWVGTDVATQAELAAAVSAHEADTTAVHGVANTALLGRSLDVVQGLTIGNTAAETTLYSFTIPGGVLPMRLVRLVMCGDYTNDTGVARALTLRVKFGALTLFDDVTATFAAGAVKREWRLLVDLFGNGSGGQSQVVSGQFSVGPPHAATTGRGDLAAALATDAVFGGSGDQDALADQALTVTVQHPAASASLEMRRWIASLSLA